MLGMGKRRPVLLPAGWKELECVVCHSIFRRPPHLVPRAKVCTPSSRKHKTTLKEQPDGAVKRIGCSCCLCIYKKTLSKRRSLNGKIIPSIRVTELLRRTAQRYGDGVRLAFRLGINAMLRVQELAGMKTHHVHLEARPLPRIDVLALKKKVEIVYQVDIDPDTAKTLGKRLRTRKDDSLFGMPVRTLQHKFKQVVREMDLGHLSIHALRHTGIWNRARSVTNLNDLNYLREQARHESIETTKLYLGYEQQERMAMARKVKWV